MGQRNVLYFMQLFLHYNYFGENFIGQVKEPLYSVYIHLNLKHEKKNSKQNVKAEKMVVILVTFSAVLYCRKRI